MAHTKKMMTEDWIAVEDNPIQRDTERHAEKARHLHTAHPTHSVVHAAELPSGKLVKLDGHTRALMWKRKDIPAPTQVVVVIYPVKDRSEAEQLYKDFDSKDAMETTRHKVEGAYNKHNFDPQSPLLQTGNIVQGLRLAYGVLIGGTVKTFGAGGGAPNQADRDKKKDKRTDRQIATSNAEVYTLINEFSYELHMLDGFGLRQGQITSGIIGAFIVSARRYGHKVTPFWTGVFGDGGTRHNGKMDGIQAVHELLLSSKGKSGRLHIADIAARALSALEKWLADETLSKKPSPLDTLGYLAGYEKPNERLIKSVDKYKQGSCAR